MITQDKFVGPGSDGRTVQDNVAANQSVLDSLVDITDLAMLQDNRAGNFGIFDEAVMIDAGKGTHVSINQPGISPNNGGPPDHTVDYLGSLLYRYPAIYLAVPIHITGNR